MKEYNLRLVISHKDIMARVRELGQILSETYRGKNLVLVGILKGAFMFLADLIREMSIPVEIDFVRLASYGTEAESSGKVKLTKDIELAVGGKHVVVVEDIIDTGYTIDFLVDHLKGKNPESVKVCALIDKSERRERTVQLDFVGFRITKGFLVGYGLDFNEKYRYLKSVHEIIFR